MAYKPETDREARGMGLVILVASALMWGIYVWSLLDEAKSKKSKIEYDQHLLFLGPVAMASGTMVLIFGKKMYDLQDSNATTDLEKAAMFFGVLVLTGCGYLGTQWTQGQIQSYGYHQAQKVDPSIQKMQEEVRQKYKNGPTWRSGASSPSPQSRP